MIDVSANLKAYIKAKGLTIGDFEKQMGWKEGSVRKLRPGSSIATFVEIKKQFPDFDPLSCSCEPTCTQDIKDAITLIEVQVKALQDQLELLKRLAQI